MNVLWLIVGETTEVKSWQIANVILGILSFSDDIIFNLLKMVGKKVLLLRDLLMNLCQLSKYYPNEFATS